MKNREVYFSERITDESIKKLQERIISLLEQDGTEKITLYLSSGGGTNNAALAFYEWVRIKGIFLEVIAVAGVASAAIILLMSGKERVVTENTHFLIHPGGSIKYNFYTFLQMVFSHRRYREDLAWHKSNMKKTEKIIVAATKISPKEIHDALTKSFIFLSAQEAKDLGLIQKII